MCHNRFWQDMIISASESPIRWYCGDCLFQIKMLVLYNRISVPNVMLNLNPEAYQRYFAVHVMRRASAHVGIAQGFLAFLTY